MLVMQISIDVATRRVWLEPKALFKSVAYLDMEVGSLKGRTRGRQLVDRKQLFLLVLVYISHDSLAQGEVNRFSPSSKSDLQRAH